MNTSNEKGEWAVDGNEIWIGDAVEIMLQMPKECIDLVVTSPPY